MKRRSPWVLALFLLVAPVAHVAAQQDGSLHGRLPDGLTCLSCHTTAAWSPTRSDLAFDHADTGFPLDGRHAQVTCVNCHGLVFSDLDRMSDCEACHVDVHRGTITAACIRCHTTESFASLDRGLVHPADFPLEGAHLQTSCESCHVDDVGGAYRPVDRECTACHRDEYMATTLVDHQALGFSLDCTQCHTPLDFRDVVFDHTATSNGFELIGGHAGIECTTCHNGPGGDVGFNASGPEDCYSCHAAEYNREHGGQGFPTDCRACHDTFDWDSGFNHTFEIFRGAHASAWDTCADCHEVPGDFASFTCVTCHSQGETDGHHREVRGYLYDSPTCLRCHPTGRGDD